MDINKTYILDLETQKDLFGRQEEVASELAREVIRNIEHLLRWAVSCGIPVISSVVRFHNPWDCPYPVRVCLEDTPGEQKLPQTIMESHFDFGLRNTTDFSHDFFERYQQIIFEKRDTDIFNHQRIERMITDLDCGRFIVCGAGISYSIVQAVVGLRSRGFPVVVASDAILPLSKQSESELSIMRMLAKGAVFCKTGSIIVPTPLKIHSRHWKTDKDVIKPGRK